MFLINILLVDDHALFSKSLKIALSDYPEITSFESISDISRLDSFIDISKPDILLLDINLKNITSGDGLELTKELLYQYPEQKIVILSGYDLPVYCSEAEKIGAKGFINKNIEPEKLVQHIFEKLDVTSSVEAVTKAIQMGYIPSVYNFSFGNHISFDVDRMQCRMSIWGISSSPCGKARLPK